MSQDGHTSTAANSFAGRLKHLIATVHPPERGPYSYREIARGIAHHEGALSSQHLHLLASGQQKWPRLHHTQALADFFGVPAAYFTDDELANTVNEKLENTAAWRDEEVRIISERVSSLSPNGRAAISTMLDHLIVYERPDRNTPQRHRAATPAKPRGRSI